jgi:hypothetical protein
LCRWPWLRARGELRVRQRPGGRSPTRRSSRLPMRSLTVHVEQRQQRLERDARLAARRGHLDHRGRVVGLRVHRHDLRAGRARQEHHCCHVGLRVGGISAGRVSGRCVGLPRQRGVAGAGNEQTERPRGAGGAGSRVVGPLLGLGAGPSAQRGAVGRGGPRGPNKTTGQCPSGRPGRQPRRSRGRSRLPARHPLANLAVQPRGAAPRHRGASSPALPAASSPRLHRS